MKKRTKGIKYWKGKAWEEFSRFIRIRDALRTTGAIATATCCSCGRIYPAFGQGCLQAGHFIPGRRNAILFDPCAVHAQCYNCNVTLKGNWPGYHGFMVKHYGQEMIDKLLIVSRKVHVYQATDLEEMRDYFKSKADELLKTKERMPYEDCMRHEMTNIVMWWEI